MQKSKPLMKTVSLPSGERVPALGLGTWRFGENPSTRAEEIATLRMALLALLFSTPRRCMAKAWRKSLSARH